MPDDLTIEERIALLTKNYSTEAAVYERTWAPSLRIAGRQLLDRLASVDGGSVLDLGAGVGALLPDIASSLRAGRVVGVDRSEGMIARSRGFPVAVMDGMHLGFRSGSFDVVTMLFLIFHLPDQVAGLREVRRVLRAGGLIAVATWFEGRDEWPARNIWNDELDAHGAEPADPLYSRHDLVGEPDKLEALLERAGYEEIEIWTGTLESQWEVRGFIKFVTGMAVAKRRLDSLDPEVRPRCLERVERRLASAPETEFVLRAEVVFATATSPP